jgi:hypothetical protein
MMATTESKATDIVSADIVSELRSNTQAKAGGVFHVQCYDAQGRLKWDAEAPNLVVNVGLKDMNDKYFSGATYTAAWYLGLYGAGATNNPAAANTAASHAGWTEVTTYSQATRPVATFGAATTADPSVITNSAAPAAFSINGTTIVGGAFLISNNTKGGTTGVLFSAADFGSPGDRSVVSGDTLTVTYTFSLDAV